MKIYKQLLAGVLFCGMLLGFGIAGCGGDDIIFPDNYGCKSYCGKIVGCMVDEWGYEEEEAVRAGRVSHRPFKGSRVRVRIVIVAIKLGGPA